MVGSYTQETRKGMVARIQKEILKEREKEVMIHSGILEGSQMEVRLQQEQLH